ncbi:MAG: hypothetical protein RIG26_14725 [Thalassospira sp.]|uniref:substrate-binding periplasmic protein n=2 Tax=Thalassospira sp. TaxID=1912094 RepID=UPI0032EF4A91
MGFSHTAQAQPDPEFYEVKLPMDISSDFCQGRITWNQQVEYQIDLLRLAAKLSGKDIIITPVCMDYPTEERRITMLQANDDINMVHFGTSQEREDKLLAAYVPLYLGTTGLRFFMVRRELLDDLQAVHTLDDLRKFTMGQGLGWPDSAILIENGFSVADGRYKTLHRMLDARRFDLYPRAYWQIIGEWNWMKDQAPGIVVSPDVALYYPQPIYFFFSPHHPELRDAIQTGLERAYSNGMLFDLLKSHPDTAPSFGGIKLNNVRVIRGMNNKLPDRSRHAMSEYGLFD